MPRKPRQHGRHLKHTNCPEGCGFEVDDSFTSAKDIFNIIQRHRRAEHPRNKTSSRGPGTIVAPPVLRTYSRLSNNKKPSDRNNVAADTRITANRTRTGGRRRNAEENASRERIISLSGATLDAGGKEALEVEQYAGADRVLRIFDVTSQDINLDLSGEELDGGGDFGELDFLMEEYQSAGGGIGEDVAYGMPVDRDSSPPSFSHRVEIEGGKWGDIRAGPSDNETIGGDVAYEKSFGGNFDYVEQIEANDYEPESVGVEPMVPTESVDGHDAELVGKEHRVASGMELENSSESEGNWKESVLSKPRTTYTCGRLFCRASFRSSTLRDNHRRTVHDCPLCDTVSKGKAALQMHIQNIHRIQEIEVFINGKSLLISREQDGHFPCHLCSKRFRNAASMRRHYRVGLHTGGNENDDHCVIQQAKKVDPKPYTTKEIPASSGDASGTDMLIPSIVQPLSKALPRPMIPDTMHRALLARRFPIAGPSIDKPQLSRPQNSKAIHKLPSDRIGHDRRNPFTPSPGHANTNAAGCSSPSDESDSVSYSSSFRDSKGKGRVIPRTRHPLLQQFQTHGEGPSFSSDGSDTDCD